MLGDQGCPGLRRADEMMGGRESYRHGRRASPEGDAQVCLKDSILAGVTGKEFRASREREDYMRKTGRVKTSPHCSCKR